MQTHQCNVTRPLLPCIASVTEGDRQQHRSLSAATVPTRAASSNTSAQTPRSRRMWSELSTCDWSSTPETELRSAVALLPIGAIEQHGPHLPTGVDTYQCVGIVQSALDGLDAGEYDRDGPVARHIFTLPTQDIGTSHEHLEYVSIVQSTSQTILPRARNP
jgi:hypothetical protein